MKSENPFPFIGAGFGQYYEYFNITVKFEKAPDKKQRKKILKNAPQPFGNELGEDRFHGSILAICSDQFVNLYIEIAYGNSKGTATEGDPCFYRSDEAAEAFEEDVVRWLKEIHAICPIEIVYRPEDSEAGGTELSDWHEQSVKPGLTLIKKWKSQSDQYDEDEQEYLNDVIEAIKDYNKHQ